MPSTTYNMAVQAENPWQIVAADISDTQYFFTIHAGIGMTGIVCQQQLFQSTVMFHSQ